MLGMQILRPARALQMPICMLISRGCLFAYQSVSSTVYPQWFLHTLLCRPLHILKTFIVFQELLFMWLMFIYIYQTGNLNCEVFKMTSYYLI